MSDRFIDWLFDTLISVDVQHQELLRGFGVLLLIPFALFLLSYVRVSYFAFIKDRARKGALDTVIRVLAAELGPRNIRVNSIARGSVETEGLHATGVIGTDFEKKLTADTPLGRLGQPEDIAKVAVFLASDESRWITGERVVVSGGLR
jgi:NAD(P)-dependent dehydrogenase (short-subunit alcohol dehydrogenase family)